MPLEADTAAAAASKALGTPGPAISRPLRQVSVYVPHQSQYPLGFLARIETVSASTSGESSSVYYHFGRAAAGARWLADFSSVADTRSPIRFALDQAGYANILPIDAAGYVVQPRDAASALNDYLTSGLESGTPSGPFVPGKHTSGVVKSLRDSYDGLDNQGYEPSGDFAVREFTRAYRAADGSPVVLFAVEATSRLALKARNETSVTCIVQSADHLQQWGGLVPSGRYSEIDFVDLLQLIALDPRRGPNGRVDVVAGSDDRVAAHASAKATRPWLPSCPSS